MESVTLSHLDHIPSASYPRGAFYLRLAEGTTPESTFADLLEGFHRTVQQIPWLNGKIHHRDVAAPDWRPGQLEIRYLPLTADAAKPYQLKFNKLDTSKTYEELEDEGFPMSTFEDEELLWFPFKPKVLDGSEVFVAQANFLPGGCILCISMCHAASDAWGANFITKIWADNCCSLGDKDANAAEANGVTSESSNRTLLRNVIEHKGRHRKLDDIDPDTWWSLGGGPRVAEMDRNMSSTSKEFADPNRSIGEALKANRKRVAATFYISPSKFSLLQGVTASPEHAEDLSTQSKQDVLYALIWRCLLKARFPDPDVASAQDRTARLLWPEDCRSSFSESIAPTYLGNLYIFSSASLSLSTLVSPQTPLADVLEEIRKAKRALTPAAIQDACTLASTVSNYGLMGLHSMQIDSSSLLITSALMFPPILSLGSRNFASNGRPDAMRIIMGSWKWAFSMCVIMPRRASGGIEIVLHLFEDEMQRLLQDEEFGKYALYVAS